ncbi:DUF6074 family protein [Afipia felis]
MKTSRPKSVGARSAKILVFPLRNRIGFVERQARQIAGMNAVAGERHLAHQLRVQRETLERKGVDEALIQSELKQLEGAIRAALWRTVFAPRGLR